MLKTLFYFSTSTIIKTGYKRQVLKMKDVEQRKAAKEFAEYWKDRGDEKQDTQSFWLSFLQKVFVFVH